MLILQIQIQTRGGKKVLMKIQLFFKEKEQSLNDVLHLCSQEEEAFRRVVVQQRSVELYVLSPVFSWSVLPLISFSSLLSSLIKINAINH